MPESNFIDYVKLYCRSGRGGAGSAHLHRDRFNPKGGPDGGDGGRGGNIYLRGNQQLWTLLPLKYRKHIHAGNGQPGGSALKTGANGEDIVLDVPLGTLARNAETGEIVVEITRHNEKKILLSGGRGGLGNNHFKSAVQQTPRFAQPGEDETEGWFILELKLLADVGLVGFPNAGKSTLLSVISAAKPKIADYPFTTLVPSLGIVSYREDLSFVMADIPGIIEDAHKGKGMGLRFLRHIERNAVLLFLVPADSNDIKKEYNVLVSELNAYNKELLDKQRLLAVSKADLLDAELQEAIREELNGIDHLFISSVTEMGLPLLKEKIWKLLNQKPL